MGFISYDFLYEQTGRIFSRTSDVKYTFILISKHVSFQKYLIHNL